MLFIDIVRLSAGPGDRAPYALTNNNNHHRVGIQNLPAGPGPTLSPITDHNNNTAGAWRESATVV